MSSEQRQRANSKKRGLRSGMPCASCLLSACSPYAFAISRFFLKEQIGPRLEERIFVPLAGRSDAVGNESPRVCGLGAQTISWRAAAELALLS